MMLRSLVRAGLSRLLRAIPPADFTTTTSADAALDEASRLRAKVDTEGAAEEREAVCVWMTATWGTQEDAETNGLVGEVVQNIRDGHHRARGAR